MLDVDRIIYETSHYTAHRSETLPETYTGSKIRIYTDDVQAGYVRLISEEEDTTELLLSDLYTLTDLLF